MVDLEELKRLLNEPDVDGFMYVVFRGKDSASIREYGKIYPQNTTPQTKPLTDDEIDKILESLDVYIDTHAGVKLFARAIEAKVRGEK